MALLLDRPGWPPQPNVSRHIRRVACARADGWSWWDRLTRRPDRVTVRALNETQGHWDHALFMELLDAYRGSPCALWLACYHLHGMGSDAVLFADQVVGRIDLLRKGLA